MDPVEPVEPMSERPSFSHRRVFVGFALSLLAAAGAAIYLYVAYIRYDRVAALHLPQKAFGSVGGKRF